MTAPPIPLFLASKMNKRQSGSTYMQLHYACIEQELPMFNVHKPNYLKNVLNMNFFYLYLFSLSIYEF